MHTATHAPKAQPTPLENARFVDQAHTALTEASAALDALEALLMGQSDDQVAALKGFDLVQLVGPSVSDRIRFAMMRLECCAIR